MWTTKPRPIFLAQERQTPSLGLDSGGRRPHLVDVQAGPTGCPRLFEQRRHVGGASPTQSHVFCSTQPGGSGTFGSTRLPPPLTTRFGPKSSHGTVARADRPDSTVRYRLTAPTGPAARSPHADWPDPTATPLRRLTESRRHSSRADVPGPPPLTAPPAPNPKTLTPHLIKAAPTETVPPPHHGHRSAKSYRRSPGADPPDPHHRARIHHSSRHHRRRTPASYRPQCAGRPRCRHQITTHAFE